MANDGEIKYYKDKKCNRGSFWLTKDSHCLKTARGSFEIRIPGRAYQLEEAQKAGSQLDEWIQQITDVIKLLK